LSVFDTDAFVCLLDYNRLISESHGTM